MAVQGFPVVIVDSGGVPVRPVDDRYPLMTVATNGFGLPITISDLGAPFIVQGYTPPAQLAFLATENGDPLVTENGEYLETYPEA